jgi:hypothetical protein
LPPYPGDCLSQLIDPVIEEDTEAAEALRANANVKVRKMGKVMRGVGAQSVRNLVKCATLRGQSGNRHGKPPRIPPGLMATSHVDDQNGGNGVFIFPVKEEAELIEEADEESDHDSLDVHSAEGGGSDDSSVAQQDPNAHEHAHAHTTEDYQSLAAAEQDHHHLAQPSTSQEDHLRAEYCQTGPYQG